MELVATKDVPQANTNVEKAKEPCESFKWIEQRPEPGWFVKVKSYNGRAQWFVRFRMTGTAVRLYGPFASRRQCLRFLDDALSRLLYDGITELDEAQNEYRMKPETYEPSFSYPIVERLIAIHADGIDQQKGR